MKKPRRSTIAVVAGAVVLVVASSASSAVATRMITGADIENHTITGDDLKAGAITLKHLDRTSIKAGHVHHSRAAVIVGPRATKAKVTRDSNRAVVLYNQAMGKVATMSLPAGTYTVIATGLVNTMTISSGGKYYPSKVWCQLTALGNYVAQQNFGLSPVASESYIATIAMSRVISLTSPGDVTLSCEVDATVTISGMTGGASGDLVAFPVTSYNAG